MGASASSISSSHLKDDLNSGNGPIPFLHSPHIPALGYGKSEIRRACLLAFLSWLRSLLAHQPVFLNSEGFLDEGRISPGSFPEINGAWGAWAFSLLGWLAFVTQRSHCPPSQGHVSVPPPCAKPRIGETGGAGGIQFLTHWKHPWTC